MKTFEEILRDTLLNRWLDYIDGKPKESYSTDSLLHMGGGLNMQSIIQLMEDVAKQTVDLCAEQFKLTTDIDFPNQWVGECEAIQVHAMPIDSMDGAGLIAHIDRDSVEKVKNMLK